MKTILMSPVHYVVSDLVGSETRISLEVLWALGEYTTHRIIAITNYALISKEFLAKLANKPIRIISLRKEERSPSFGLFKKALFYYRIYRIGEKILANEDIDILHHWLPFGYEQGFNLLALKENKVPFILGPVQSPQLYVGNDEYLGEKFVKIMGLKKGDNKIGKVAETLLLNFGTPLLKKLFTKTLIRANKILALTKYAKLLYSKYVEEDKIEVLPWGIDTTAFLPYYNKHFEKPKDDLIKIITTPGSLTKRKGVEYLIMGFWRLLRSLEKERSTRRLTRRIILEILGKGPQEEALKELSRTLHIEKYVRFLGFLPREQVYAELSDADIFVLPSLSESFSISTLEAMSVGLPCVVTNVPGPNELVVEGVNGYIVAPKDFNALANRLFRLVVSENLRRKMGIASRERCIRYYDWKIIIKRLEKIYNETS